MSSKSKELLWGVRLIGFQLMWVFSWFIYTHFIAGSFMQPYYPEMSLEYELISPFTVKGFMLGTDNLGRSLFEVLSQGMGYTIVTAVVVSLLSLSIGVVVGYIVVVNQKLLGKFFEILTNVVFIFPSILIAILIMSYSGQSWTGLIISLTVTGWPAYARIARTEVTRVMGMEFFEASRALGASKIRLFFSVIIPSVAPILVINIVMGMSGVIISEASLGFLGLGGSEYSLGVLLGYGKNVLLEAPFMTTTLSLILAGLIMSLNLLGDGLRDYWDPKQR